MTQPGKTPMEELADFGAELQHHYGELKKADEMVATAQKNLGGAMERQEAVVDKVKYLEQRIKDLVRSI